MERTTESVDMPQRTSLGRRILMSPLVRILLGAAWVGVPVYVGQAVAWIVVYAFVANPWGAAYFGIGLAFALVALGLYITFVCVVERRRPAELSLRGAAVELLIGMGLGLALVSMVVGGLWLAGSYHVTGTNGLGSMAFVFGIVGTGAVVEELIARGIVLRIVEESFGTLLALLVSSALFGVIHYGNANATLYSSVAVAFEGGLMLGAAYVLTRRLWLAIGLHMMWNYAQAGIYGVAVSGYSFPGLLRARLEGPDWLTGGAFGIEASVLSLGPCLALSVLMLILAARRRDSGQ